MAMLESTGSKGSVQVNGSIVKKTTSRVLKSGDEIIFGSLGNHAYVSFCYLRVVYVPISSLLVIM